MNPLRTSRRGVLQSLVGTSLLLPGLVSRLLAESDSRDPLAPRPSPQPARAKRVIFIFSNGGVSHMDTFDYKPLLQKLNGQAVPASIRKAVEATRFANVFENE